MMCIFIKRQTNNKQKDKASDLLCLMDVKISVKTLEHLMGKNLEIILVDCFSFFHQMLNRSPFNLNAFSAHDNN